MNLWEGLLVALESLRASKMRSALTMLGIVIGVASVIAVVAIGQGGRAAVMSEFNKVGSNLLQFSPKMGYGSISSRDMFTRQDVEAIKRQVPGVLDAAPTSYGQAEVRINKNTKQLQVIATTASFKRVTTVELVAGRFFSDEEERSKMRVAVVEEKLVKEMLPAGNWLGHRIYINDTPFKIIGVLKSENTSLNIGPPMYLSYLPFGSWQALTGANNIQAIQVKMADGAKEKEVSDKTLALLHSRHHNKDKYQMQSLEQLKNGVSKATGILEMIIGSIAAISLLVGGIGVMNIMLVSVTERTREIGIRKALGASHGDILRQFLLESALLCFIGGLLGILVGAGGAFAVSKIAKWPPLISLSTIGIAVGFSLMVGLFFGLYPASRAARLDPIEALRYE